MRGRSLIAIAAAAVLCAGCGAQSSTSGGSSPKTHGRHRSAQTAVPRGHPQAVEPVAGAAAAATVTAPRSATVSVSTPGAARSLPQPESISEIRRQLTASGMTASPTQATLTSAKLAIAPVAAPAAVQAVIAACNQIAHLPYIWGGGHLTYEDTGYDCSGSLSYVLAAAGLLNGTETSGQFMSWGKPGPGKWITVFATNGHTFMYVAGLRFDTVALAETGSRWSDSPADEPDLSSFVERHPAGL